MKKKKRFYNNKRRSEKWTEKPTGRKIHFADKYIQDGADENKFNTSQKTKKPFFTRERAERALRRLIVGIVCIAIIGVGYTIMDVHIDRNAMPIEQTDTSDGAELGKIELNARAYECQPLSLDGDIMLDAVIDTAFVSGYTAVCFDIKRSNGTIGYESKLATISAYGAVSSASGNLADSVKKLNKNDLLPIGRIAVYKDNVAPAADMTSAVFDKGTIYRDSGSNSYLNPDSESAYNYLKSIIDEAMSMGVTVFVLDDYDLPSEISQNHSDGFDNIAEKLYNDFGSSLKLLRAVNINLSSDNAKALEQEWLEKTEQLGDDSTAIFYVTAKDPEMTKKLLDSRGTANYIISE